MRTVNLNGVHLTIATKQEVKELHLKPIEWLNMGCGLFLHGLRTKGDYIKASNQEQQGEIDYALPEPWVSSLRRSKQDEVLQWYVWSYANNSISGGPLDIRNLLPGIYIEVMSRVVMP